MPIRRIPLLAAVVATVASCTFNPELSGPPLGPDAGNLAPDEDADGQGRRDVGGDPIVPDIGSSPVDAGAAPDGGMPEDMTSPVDDLGTTDTGGPPVDMAPPAEDMGLPRTIICGGTPIDPRTDRRHCGQCNNQCDEDYGGCVDGACLCPGAAVPCGRDNSCTDTRFDSDHCGTCGNSCGPGGICANGACQCRPELSACNGRCVDLDSDPRNCGSCGNGCNGKVCLDGECLERNICPVTTVSCNEPGGTACLRERDGDLHCGPTIGDSCGEQCDADEFCYAEGPIAQPRCVEFRPGLGCTTCPCPDCGDDEACFTTNDLPGVAFCARR